MGKKIDQYVACMMELVMNPIHGYDQNHRWGEDYDCSSAIITAVQTVIPVKDAGATYTGNMRKAFKKCGFTDIPYKKGMTLIRGDILLNEKYHTAMYVGNGKVAQFSINEKGTTTGGKTGDQTGKESSVGNFYEYSKGWDCVLRYEHDTEEVIKVNISLPLLQLGSHCPEVGTVQVLLNSLNYLGKNGKHLTVDNQFGQNVDFAVRQFQKDCGLNPDGLFGQKSWTLLLSDNYC